MGKRIFVEKGERYGRFTIIKEIEKRKKKRYFQCKCDCGNIRNVRFVALRAGTIKSCGCLRDEQNRTVAVTHGKNKTRLYSIWHGMKQRCLNPNLKGYKYYGGRGIKVCKTWLEFEGFYDWAVNNGYNKNLTIERIDVNGNYEPHNCEWIPMENQSKNTRRTTIIEFNGTSLCVAEWARKIGISNSAMQKRIKNWPIEKALTTPKPY